MKISKPSKTIDADITKNKNKTYKSLYPKRSNLEQQFASSKSINAKNSSKSKKKIIPNKSSRNQNEEMSPSETTSLK